jgi:hypothetical protein
MSNLPDIPAKFLAVASSESAARRAAERARQQAQQRQAERHERLRRCEVAVESFKAAAEALGSATRQDDALSRKVHTTMLKACTALAQAGRLGRWDKIDLDRTYSDLRTRSDKNGPGWVELSRAAFDWSVVLFDAARTGQLPNELIAQTWRAEGLRDAFEWLQIFLFELALGGGTLYFRREPKPEPAPMSSSAANAWLTLVQVDRNLKPAAETAELSRDRVKPAKRSRMTKEQANQRAQRLVKKKRRAFFAMSQRQQAKLIGCSWATWKATEFYKVLASQGKFHNRSKTSSPKVESLSAGREKVAGQGERDEVLSQLIASQEADREPSPLEDDLPDRARKTHFRKKL